MYICKTSFTTVNYIGKKYTKKYHLHKKTLLSPKKYFWPLTMTSSENIDKYEHDLQEWRDSVICFLSFF